MTRTILIVDDHAPFRSAVGAVLGAEGFTVIGESALGETALAQLRRLRPDIVLVDIQLPDIDGFQVAERVAEGPDAPMVILISTREAYEYGGRIDHAPVAGFIPKRALTGAAIRALAGW
jgi:DNA-binding NarL/FixJ family response regulator